MFLFMLAPHERVIKDIMY